MKPIIEFLTQLKPYIGPFVDIQLLTFMAIMAIVISRMRNLFGAAMLTGIFSLISAGLFVVMDAVDVAFTEASVGVGISTVLMLAALSLTTSEEKPSRHSIAIIPLLAVLLTGGVLIYATLDMPEYGTLNAPIHHHVADKYIKESAERTGVPNIVTSVLASYRGYDTMGETTVIFTAGIGVLLLMGAPRRRKDPWANLFSQSATDEDSEEEEKQDDEKKSSSESPTKAKKETPEEQKSKPAQSESSSSQIQESSQEAHLETTEQKQSKKQAKRLERKKRKDARKTKGKVEEKSGKKAGKGRSSKKKRKKK